MSKLQLTCPECKTHKESRFINNVGSIQMNLLECGHIIVTPLVVSATDQKLESMTSADGRKLFPFQREVVKFMDGANGRCILNLEMGLGKTICALAFMHLHAEEDVFPALVITKAKITRQWFAETVRWTGRVAQVFTSSKESPHTDIFDIGIISVDLLASMYKKLSMKYKTLIIDECQTIKNPGAQRTQAAQALAQEARYVIPMSGTPVKNNVAEFFVTFNMVDPGTYHTYSNFVRDWVDVTAGPSFFGGVTKRLGGILPYRLERWEKQTSRILIRKTREEVMPDLPKKFRQNLMCTLDQKVAEAYLKELAKFSEYYGEVLTSGKGFTMAAMGNILGFMSTLRRITGVSKAEVATEWIQDFLESTDRPLAVFTHHIETRNLIHTYLQAQGIKPVMIEDSNKARVQACSVSHNWVTEHPETDRVALLSTLADGEGLNLQRCADVLMVEHQWNPANEEQAEDRFPRPGSKASQINVTYIVAAGTIDEFLVKLKEHKRAAIKSAHGETVNWNESEVVQQLAQMLFEQGKSGFSGTIKLKGKE